MDLEGTQTSFVKTYLFFSENGYDAYAIDLLGYGYGDKPNPRQYNVNELYNFETWGSQISSFIRDVVKKPCILVCNSVGGVAGLQASLTQDNSKIIKGIILIDISLRLLHVTKQNPLQRVVVPVIQRLFRETFIGKYFFKQVKKWNITITTKVLFNTDIYAGCYTTSTKKHS